MPNKVLTAPETPITFRPSGGDVAFGVTSLGATAGRVSAQHDRGAGAKARRYRWEARTKAGATPTIGQLIEVYIATAESDPAKVDGNVGTSDAALSSAEKRRNLRLIGAIICDVANTTDPFQASGIVEIQARYVQVVWYNPNTWALSGTAADHEFVLIPIPDEIQ